MTHRKIFISYRRADSAYAAGRLFDHLSTHFGEENIFMDVEGLAPGVDFIEAIKSAVSACGVLIALIGPQWLTIKDEKGQRRLDNPEDFVRLELATALDRDVRVIPILVQGVRMPKSNELPPVLQQLARLNALEIRHERFKADTDRLELAIETYLEEDAQRRRREASEQKVQVQDKPEQQTQEIEQHEVQINNYLAEAQAAMERESWETAQTNYRKILKLRATHIEAQTGLQIASKNLELAHLYGQAILLQDEGKFERALSNLRHIQSKDANYRNVSELITTIETLFSEKAQQTETTAISTSSDHKHSFISVLHSMPRGLWILSGSIGLILIVVLAFWGGNSLLVYLRGTETTPITTSAISPAPIKTDTLNPAIAASPISLIEAETPFPADTSTLSPAITSSQTLDKLSMLITDDYGVRMALIAAGPFDMGSDANVALAECQKFRNDCKRSWFEDEEPIHTVMLDDFYIDQYEVTNEQFVAFLNEQDWDGFTWLNAGDTDARIYKSGDSWQVDTEYAKHPVTEVSWYGAQAYCQWRGARLPTEAEWEKAARGDREGTLYPWGNEKPNCLLANFNGEEYCLGDTSPVGSYVAHGELFDMAGNVWEWTADWYDSNYYVNSPANNPQGPDDGENRVVRGGSWARNPYELMVAYRINRDPSNTSSSVGFRCVTSALSSSGS